MLYPYRYYFLAAFILLLAAMISIGEHIRNGSRTQYIADLIRQTHDNIPLLYPSESTGVFIKSPAISLPSDPNISRSLGDFPSICQENWLLAIALHKKYQDIDRSTFTLEAKNEYQENYTGETSEGKIIHLRFDRNQLDTVQEQSEKEKFSISINYDTDKQPIHILFGIWTHDSMGYDLSYYSSGVPRSYSFIHQGSFLGPSVNWNEDGSVQQAYFYKHPKPIEIQK